MLLRSASVGATGTFVFEAQAADARTRAVLVVEPVVADTNHAFGHDGFREPAGVSARGS